MTIRLNNYLKNQYLKIAPSFDQRKQQQLCRLCERYHPGECNQKLKYLANKNFECGCNPKINLHGKENYCCEYKWALNFARAEWGRYNNGRIRCFKCKKKAEQQNDQQKQPIKRLQCENIIYQGNDQYGPCNNSEKGFNSVKKREYQKWNDQTEQIEFYYIHYQYILNVRQFLLIIH